MTTPPRYENIGKTVSVEQAKRACLDKVRYPNKNKARDKAAKYAAKHPDWEPMRPYRCEVCGGWHLTKSMPYGLSKRPREARAA